MKDIKEVIAEFYAIQMTLDPYQEEHDWGEIIDVVNEYNPKVETCKMYLNLMIIKCISEGWTEDEILEMIDNYIPEGFTLLNKSQKKYVRESGKKLIIKRKEMMNL